MLRQIADLLLMPLGFCLAVGAASLLLSLLGRTESRRWMRRAAFSLGLAAVGLLYLASIRPTGELLLWLIERPYPVVAPETIEPVDAVFVFGGGTPIVRRSDDTPALDSGARFDAAMRLFEAGRAKFLVLSGAGSTIPGDPRSQADHQREEALRRGVPGDRILDTPPVLTTADEVREVTALARRLGWRRVAFATESHHLGRALMLGRNSGLELVPFSSGRAPPPIARHWMLTLLPSLESLGRTTRAWHEILGRLAS